jgi:hypothetical protein
MIYGPAFVILGKYFSRHLTFAQAFVTTGVSNGAIIMPLVIRAILDEFSFPAGMLIIGGVLAQIVVCACFLRPVAGDSIDKTKAKVQQELTEKVERGVTIDNVPTEELEHLAAEDKVKDTDLSNELRSDNTGAKQREDEASEELCEQNTPHTGEKSVTKRGRGEAPKARRWKALLDFSVCKSPAFWVLMFHQAFGFLIGTLGPAFIPPLAKEKGLFG